MSDVLTLKDMKIKPVNTKYKGRPGRKPSTEPTKRVIFELPLEVYEGLKQAAYEQRTSMKALVVEALEAQQQH